MRETFHSCVVHVGVVTGVSIERAVSEFILITDARHIAHNNGSGGAAIVDTTDRNTS